MIENPKAARAVEYFTAIRAKCFEVLGLGPDAAAERGIPAKDYKLIDEIDTLAMEGLEEMS